MFASRRIPNLFIFVAISISVTFISFQTSHAKTRTIWYHPGGEVYKILGEIRRTNIAGTKIRIVGTCLSACTLFLASKHVCLTKTAKLKFHQAQAGHGSRFKARPHAQGNRLMMAKYPPNLRKWIRQKGGLPWHGWLTLNSRTAIKNGIAKYC